MRELDDLMGQAIRRSVFSDPGARKVLLSAALEGNLDDDQREQALRKVLSETEDVEPREGESNGQVE